LAIPEIAAGLPDRGPEPGGHRGDT